jgi:hypothetical protein
MSVQHANRGIVKKDLQLYYNREFSKSFRGEATTNLIGTYSGGSANSYPSSGNSWGTYYARGPYGSGVFYSIGTIASVSGNVITVSSPTSNFNALATFDVIRPQTTGGGLTANTDYYFKRLSSTTFTLHQYDATNDASKTPEQILTYINSDTRISVNATSFPTMWWGYPHLPNSALIKTAITNGFSFDNRLHDCIRWYWFRSDAVDAMAYGVQPSYTGGSAYTFSAYIRASNQNAIGQSVRLETYYAGPNIGGPNFQSPTLTSNWQRWTTTWTTTSTSGTIIFYFWPNFNPMNVDIAEIQFEQKGYASEFAITSRSANTIGGGGGLLDMSGNNYNIDLTSSAIAFDSGGYYFNANAQGAITTPVANSILDNLSNNSHTYECWFKLLGTPPGLYGGYFFGRQGYHSGFYHDKGTPNIIYATTWYNDVTASNIGVTLSLNVWYHGVFVTDVENAMRYLYINGVLRDSATLTKQLRQYASTTPYYIGAASTDYASNSIVSTARAYNRALTNAEIQQNFNATRTTYGI